MLFMLGSLYFYNLTFEQSPLFKFDVSFILITSSMCSCLRPIDMVILLFSYWFINRLEYIYRRNYGRLNEQSSQFRVHCYKCTDYRKFLLLTLNTWTLVLWGKWWVTWFVKPLMVSVLKRYNNLFVNEFSLEYQRSLATNGLRSHKYFKGKYSQD